MSSDGDIRVLHVDDDEGVTDVAVATHYPLYRPPAL